MLLLPGIAALLAVDSWSDYQASARAIEAAYDETLLEPLSALDGGVGTGPDGEVALNAAFEIEAMFESVQARHKHLQVTMAPVNATTPREQQVLLGSGDLPPVPADAPSAPPPTGFGSAADTRLTPYYATYRGYPVRIVALQREVADASGRHWRLLIQAAESTGRRDAARRASLQRELWGDTRTLVVMVLLVWLGIGWTLRPLERLRAALRARPAHDLHPLEAGAVPYEVAPLVDAVNHHIADHREVLGQQAGFLADASHQLRTPLAIMMAQAGYALREDNPDRMRETFVAIVAQLDRSRRLSDQLLAMAHASRADTDTPPTPAPLADLNTITRGVVLQHLPLAREKGIDLGWADARGDDTEDAEGDGTDAAAPAVPVQAQAAELHEALANLLHNAIRHTPRGGSITVAVRAVAGQAVAQVRDSGPGIPPERRETVFQRFGTRSQEGGAGLGLAIARAYARRNGGDIVFADVPTGLCARLVLTLASTPVRHQQ